MNHMIIDSINAPWNNDYVSSWKCPECDSDNFITRAGCCACRECGYIGYENDFYVTETI